MIKKDRKLLPPLLFVAAMIGLTAVSVVAEEPDDQYDHQVALLPGSFIDYLDGEVFLSAVLAVCFSF